MYSILNYPIQMRTIHIIQNKTNTFFTFFSEIMLFWPMQTTVHKLKFIFYQSVCSLGIKPVMFALLVASDAYECIDKFCPINPVKYVQHLLGFTSM